MRTALLLLALAALPCRAGDGDLSVPKGFVEFGKFGKVRCCAPDRDTPVSTVRSELLATLRDLLTTFEGYSDLKSSQVAVGAGDTKFELKLRDKVGAVLFRDRADYQAWLGEAERGAFDIHAGESTNTVGIALEDGAVPKAEWYRLAHDLSHVFLFDYAVPWPGPVTVTCAYGDGGQRWSGELPVGEERTDVKGTPVKWKKERVGLES